ncbi:MAG: hydrogenase expression/formation protein HypE [Geminicoccaceae bacterium]
MAGFSCPVPAPPGERIQLAHGGGGRAMARLIERLFLPAFANPALDRRHDGAELALDGRTAFTTDGFVVQPLFFPGGDIGSLAVNGTVNDLAMCGARPLYLSAGFIIEDGLELATLERVTASMRDAARAAQVQIVAGDTKVVERGKADGLFITMAGIGRIEAPSRIAPASVRPGDAVLVSGDLGRHGMAVMAARHELGLESDMDSDCAPLAAPVLDLVAAGIELHCLRDLTRGGLASALVEIAETAGLAVHLEEAALPVRDDVRAACELLGLDPIYVANEGRFVAILPAPEADRALAVLATHEVSANAVRIGQVERGPAGRVTMRGPLGASRVVDMLNGEQLPRIC